MEEFLDHFCLKSKNDINQEDFELEFNYSFIAPPVDNPYFDENDPEGQEMIENQESFRYRKKSFQERK